MESILVYFKKTGKKYLAYFSYSTQYSRIPCCKETNLRQIIFPIFNCNTIEVILIAKKLLVQIH